MQNRKILFWTWVGLTLLIGHEVRATSKYEWQDVERVVTLGDVHGSYDKMMSLLTGTGVVSPEGAWIGGTNHLVFVGDITDRGPDDRQVMDLLMQVQPEAEAAGGRVHVLLGNHEVMNMVGDLRYVDPKGFADFASEDLKKDRNAALQRYRMKVAGPTVPLSQIQPAFLEAFPPGYFARLRAFWFDGQYGDWLRQQPAVIKINDVVFLHGGLTNSFAELGLDEINSQIHDSIIGFMQGAQSLYDVAGLPPRYVDIIRAAKESGESSRGKSKQVALAKSVLEYSDSIPFVPSGPLWYRGLSVENERVERTDFERSLESLDARAMVVAHTPTGTGRITSRFNGALYRVDVGMAYGREPLALVFEDETAKVFDPKVGTYGKPMPEPPQGEGVSKFATNLPEDDLLKFLKQAPITDCRLIQGANRYVEVCDLEHKDVHMRAVFQDIDEKPGEVLQQPEDVPRTYKNEIASYLLDRMLQLKIVPVTVGRKINGRTGSLQIMVENAIDLDILKTYGSIDSVDELSDQWVLADAFSAFMDVWERSNAGVMFLPNEGRVAIIDSTKAFSTSNELQMDLMPAPCPGIQPHRKLLLESLTQQKLEKQLGAYLSSPQIAALLVRRDAIIDYCTQPAETTSGGS